MESVQYFGKHDCKRQHSMRICGGLFLLLLDTGNRRERQDQSLRDFGGGGGGFQWYMIGLPNKINVDDNIYNQIKTNKMKQSTII